MMEQKIASVIKELYGLDVSPTVTRPEAQFGDGATNVALQLAKQLAKNPRDIATEVADKLRASGEYEAVEVAGPGFINITLGPEALLELTRTRGAGLNAWP